MKIPIVVNETPVSSTTFRDLGTAGAPGRALEGVGSEVGRLADRLMAQEAKIKRNKKAVGDTNYLSEFGLGITSENEKIVEELKKTPDPTNYFDNWQKQFREMVQPKIDAIQDPELKARANHLARSFETKELVQQKHYGNTLWLDTQKARISRSLDEHARRGQMEEGVRLIEENTLQGVFSPTEGDEKKRTFAGDVESARINAAIHSEDPLSANPLIDEARYRTETQKMMFRSQAKDRADKLQKEKQALEDKQVTTDAWTRLKNEWGDDYDVMNLVLNRPEGLKIYGIKTVEQKHALENILAGERAKKTAANEELRKADNRKIGDFFMAKDYGAAYSMAQESRYLQGDEKRTWANAIDQKTKEKEEKVDPLKQAVAYGRITKLLAMPDVDRDVIRDSIILDPDLGTKKFGLLDDVGKVESEETKSALRWSYDYGRGQIVPHSGFAVAPERTPAEEKKNMIFQEALKGWLRSEQNKGKAPSAQEIQNKAKELVPLYETTVAEKVETQQEQAEEERKALRKTFEMRKKQKETPASAPAPPQRPPETKKYDATATNPKTGEKMGLINGKWEPIK